MAFLRKRRSPRRSGNTARRGNPGRNIRNTGRSPAGRPAPRLALTVAAKTAGPGTTHDLSSSC
eukprot:6067198-Lingulodinium_polyedra.AAC.1